MKRILVLLLALAFPYTFGFAAAAASGTSPHDQPVVMAPYHVSERPFGFLGIKHATVSLNPLKALVGGSSVKFLQIDELEPGSPGVAAGVEPGDRIVSINGTPITKISLFKLRRMNRELAVGTPLHVEVLRPRDNTTRSIDVTVPPRAKPARDDARGN